MSSKIRSQAELHLLMIHENLSKMHYGLKIAEVCEVSGSSGSGLLVKHKALKDYFDDTKPDIGVGTSSVQDHLFLSLCNVFMESFFIDEIFLFCQCQLNCKL
ncbi:Glycerol-3-phosphate acyltransferase 1, partial [Mucuna pruriens]